LKKALKKSSKKNKKRKYADSSDSDSSDSNSESRCESSSNRKLTKRVKLNTCVKNYTPIPNKAAHYSTRLHAMSSTCFKDETPTKVTTNNMDESSESGNYSDSNHEMDDTSSVEDQKVTAVVAVIG
jgi:hypothetical protein